MKYFLLLSLVCLCAFVVARPLKSVDEEFEDFKKTFNKTYATPEEEAKRKLIFEKGYKEVKEHNEKYEKGLVSYEMDINEFSDLTFEEFEKCCTGLRLEQNLASLKSKN